VANLIAFGASTTFGQGLIDCNASTRPSKFAWPSLLSQQLNLQCINAAIPGISNLQILDRILNYSFESDDIVLVMWASQDRDMIYDTPASNITLAHWVIDRRIKPWLEVHSEYDMMMKTFLYIHHTNLHLNKLNLKFYFLDNGPIRRFVKPKWASSLPFLNASIDHVKLLYPKALDNSHPGEECHAKMASLIYSEITS
jgi:hypothetical protein